MGETRAWRGRQGAQFRPQTVGVVAATSPSPSRGLRSTTLSSSAPSSSTCTSARAGHDGRLPNGSHEREGQHRIGAVEVPPRTRGGIAGRPRHAGFRGTSGAYFITCASGRRLTWDGLSPWLRSAPIRAPVGDPVRTPPRSHPVHFRCTVPRPLVVRERTYATSDKGRRDSSGQAPSAGVPPRSPRARGLGVELAMLRRVRRRTARSVSHRVVHHGDAPRRENAGR